MFGEEVVDGFANVGEDGFEGGALFIVASRGGRGVGKAPVKFLWRRAASGRPYRTGFAGGVVTDSNDDIHYRRSIIGKFVPAFRARRIIAIADSHAMALQSFEGERIGRPGGFRTGGPGPPKTFARLVHIGLGHN